MRDWHRMQFAIALGVLALGACATTTVNQATEEQTIRGLESDWQRAIVAHDVDRIVALHATDAQLMFPNSPLATGSSAIRGAYTDFLKTPGASLTWVPAKIDVVSPTVATETGAYTMSFNGPHGTVTDRGNYTTIWHKVDGQWRVATDVAASTMPMPMPGAAAAAMDMGDTQLMMAGGLSWSDFTPAGFDPGMKLAVLRGDPGKSGPYTVRLQFPAGYRFPVHWHPGAENLTVVSGTFQLGMGNTADWGALKNYAPGDYIYIPPRHAHFGGSPANGPSVIQLHGQGPFQVIVGPPT